MNACFANLAGKTREQLERMALGKDTQDECEVQGAQLILSYMDQCAAWRESIDRADTSERLRRYRSMELAGQRLEEPYGGGSSGDRAPAGEGLQTEAQDRRTGVRSTPAAPINEPMPAGLAALWGDPQ